jgi:hypothetical protein
MLDERDTAIPVQDPFDRLTYWQRGLYQQLLGNFDGEGVSDANNLGGHVIGSLLKIIPQSEVFR